MKYSQKSFTVGAPGTKQYADNWEQTFGAKERIGSDCADCGVKGRARLFDAASRTWRCSECANKRKKR